MVWWFTSTRHDLSIAPFARMWLRGGILDRLILVTIPGWFWAGLWLLISIGAQSVVPFLLFGALPWLAVLLDAVIDNYHTRGDLERAHVADDVVLATRAEYVGGHPQLPHGRFSYLELRGDRENPTLTVTFPGVDAADSRFNIPLLDLDKMDPKSAPETSLAGSLLASLTERQGKMFAGERVTLNVDYQGPGGRKHKVELTSFLHGNDEIRNWRNYLVCAQAEADTGVTPFGPWKSLRPAPGLEEVPINDGSGDGSKLQPARRAFERR